MSPTRQRISSSSSPSRRACVSASSRSTYGLPHIWWKRISSVQEEPTMSDNATPWVDGLTFAEALAQTAQRWPDRDALVFPHLGHRRSYAEFAAEVRTAAKALFALGVKRGEHSGIWATNWPQWVVVQFAAASIGAVLVNVNPAYRGHELHYVLEQADVTTLFLTDHFKSSDYFALLAEARSAGCPKLRCVVSIKDEARPGALTWSDFLARANQFADAALDAQQAQVRPSDVVNIQYTSGTTGFPKGAMLTHRNLLLNAFYVGRRQNFKETDRLCI